MEILFIKIKHNLYQFYLGFKKSGLNYQYSMCAGVNVFYQRRFWGVNLPARFCLLTATGVMFAIYVKSEGYCTF